VKQDFNKIAKFLPVYVVLGLPPGKNAWQGYIENSFSMSWSEDRARAWWSGKAYSNLGTTHVIDGKEDAEEQVRDLAHRHRDWTIRAFDITADDCPVDLNLDEWLNDMEGGHRRKFYNRNPKFTIRETEGV
jgi:hypothetical protein